MNAPLTITDTKGLTDPLAIAELELKEKKIPLMVRRYLPDGTYEDWAASELLVEFKPFLNVHSHQTKQ